VRVSRHELLSQMISLSGRHPRCPWRGDCGGAVGATMSYTAVQHPGDLLVAAGGARWSIADSTSRCQINRTDLLEE
jgi:hypothetical protein